MGGRPGLLGIAVERAATVVANGGLSTWGFKTDLTVLAVFWWGVSD